MLPRVVVALAIALLAVSGWASVGYANDGAGEVRATGIDVSHWQGHVDWQAVSRSPVRFVIAKATEGRTFTDPRYAANRLGAETAGLAFTAYHFARPDSSANDAVLEADHFLDAADLSQRNLLPVLDMERTGGLGPVKLKTWIRTWLARVEERLGVRAVIYTAPAFWRRATGDSTWFATAGSPLWIAHYGTSEPSVPADNWAGRGWTLWQETDCARVLGIAGCVDGNRSNRDLGSLTMQAPRRLVEVA